MPHALAESSGQEQLLEQCAHHKLAGRPEGLHRAEARSLRDERPKADRGDPNKLTILYPKARPERARIAHWRARYTLVIFWFLPALAVLLALLGFTIQYYAAKLSGT
jgi:hypothetical protein